MAKEYVWNDKLLIGDKTIDEQHKQLVDTYNSLITKSETAQSIAELIPTLVFLCDYTVQHFADEEAIQKACDFPDQTRHRQLHEKFRETVSKLMGELKTEQSVEGLPEKLSTIVGVWLVNHILMEDSKMARYVTKKRFFS